MIPFALNHYQLRAHVSYGEQNIFPKIGPQQVIQPRPTLNPHGIQMITIDN